MASETIDLVRTLVADVRANAPTPADADNAEGVAEIVLDILASGEVEHLDVTPWLVAEVRREARAACCPSPDEVVRRLTRLGVGFGLTREVAEERARNAAQPILGGDPVRPSVWRIFGRVLDRRDAALAAYEAREALS